MKSLELCFKINADSPTFGFDGKVDYTKRKNDWSRTSFGIKVSPLYWHITGCLLSGPLLPTRPAQWILIKVEPIFVLNLFVLAPLVSFCVPRMPACSSFTLLFSCWKACGLSLLLSAHVWISFSPFALTMTPSGTKQQLRHF